MAILIPSKNIYDKQNPKVRDNVIERIEVGAVEVVPDNEFETPVWNETQTVKSINFNPAIIDTIDAIGSDSPDTNEEDWFYNELLGRAYFSFCDGYSNFEVNVPNPNGNKFISKLDEEKNPKMNIIYDKEVYSIEAKSDIADKTTRITSRELSYENREQTDSMSSFAVIDISHSFGDNGIVEVSKSFPLNSSVSVQDNGNLFIFNINIATSIQKMELSGDVVTSNQTQDDLILYGNETIITAKFIEFTIYGNTIGIDLTDKTVYIPETDTTSKKVHSVDGNELMQTTNYIVEKGRSLTDDEFLTANSAEGSLIVELLETYENVIVVEYKINETTHMAKIEAGQTSITIDGNGSYVQLNEIYLTNHIKQIDKAFENTKKEYSLGKETAAIRCDISDYYEYNATADKFKGDKIIATDNSTGKMSFKMYDQVIPMVYGADGKDRPMSTYQDGTPKVFQVLGSNIYYDGAVWQELSLQEVDKSEIV